MARQRIIHPEFWSSEDIIPLSPIARLLFVGIWTFADDDGRIPFKVIPLKCQIFPMDNIDVKPLIQELLSIGVITEYSYEGDNYLVVKSWHKHQTIKYPTYKHPTSEGNIKAYDRINKIHSVKKFGDKSPTSTEHVKNMSPTSTEQVPNMSRTCEEHVPPKLNKTKLSKTKLNKEENKNTLVNPTDKPKAKNEAVLVIYREKFETWWKLYKKNTNKKQAFQQWVKLKDTEMDKCINVAPSYSDSREKKFRKSPNLYIRDKLFNDEIIIDKPRLSTGVNNLKDILQDTQMQNLEIYNEPQTLALGDNYDYR